MNIEELKRLAEAATMGPWEYQKDSKDFPVKGYVTVRDCIYSVCVLPYEGIRADDRVTDNGRFIAAANPAAILELIRQIEELRDEVNGLTGSLDRAETALKEAQEHEQEPVAFWWIGPDGKDNGGPYRGKPSDAAIDNALNMGCEPVLLYARPVPAAVAVPAVPDATCKHCLQVKRELREVIAGLVAIAEKKGRRQGSPNHCHKRPGIWDDDNGDLAGKPCAECAMYDRARALLQSGEVKK